MKGFIFDMDGVLVDNHHFHFKAWMDLSKKYSFELNDEIYKKNFNGKTNVDLFRWIFGNEISEDRIAKLAFEKENNYRNAFLSSMKPLAGIIDFLVYLNEKNLKVALGTSAPKSNVDFILDNLGMRKYFHYIIDGQEVKKGKPDPEVYLRCIDGLMLKASECVVFEDAILGIEAGNNAGAEVIGVATTHTKEELLPYTNRIIKDFVGVKEVLNLF